MISSIAPEPMSFTMISVMAAAVSVSVGMAKLREYETMKHLFEEADHKLYEDKKKFHQLNQ